MAGVVLAPSPGLAPFPGLAPSPPASSGRENRPTTVRKRTASALRPCAPSGPRPHSRRRPPAPLPQSGQALGCAVPARKDRQRGRVARSGGHRDPLCGRAWSVLVHDQLKIQPTPASEPHREAPGVLPLGPQQRCGLFRPPLHGTARSVRHGAAYVPQPGVRVRERRSRSTSMPAAAQAPAQSRPRRRAVAVSITEGGTANSRRRGRRKRRESSFAVAVGISTHLVRRRPPNCLRSDSSSR